MGGYGSGRRPALVPPTTVEQCAVLDVATLTRQGLLEPDGPPTAQEGTGRCLKEAGPSGEVEVLIEWPDNDLPRLSLDYVVRIGDELRHIQVPVELTRTRLYSGGLRQWLLCPVCRRRVGKLYLPPDEAYFACRHCHELTYAYRLSRCL